MDARGWANNGIFKEKKAMQPFSHELITWSTVGRRPEHVIHAVGVQHERRVRNVKFPGSLLAYANQTIMSSPRTHTYRIDREREDADVD